MSDDRYLENWKEIKTSILAEIPVKVAGYALVAVAENGELFWGANFAKGKEQIQRGMAMISRDMKSEGKP